MGKQQGRNTNQSRQGAETSFAKGIALAVLAGIFWGITGPLGQHLFVNKGMSAAWLVPIRLISAGGIILLLRLLRQGKQVFAIWEKPANARLLCVYAVLGMMAVQYSFFVAVEASNGGTATVLQYTSPVMMILYYLFFRRKKPEKIEALAVALVVLGVFLLSTNGNVHSLIITPWGLFTGLLCAFFTCIYSMLPKNLLEQFDAVLVCGWAMFLGGIVLCVWNRPWELCEGADAEVWLYFLLLVVVGTILPFCFSLGAIPCIGPVYTNVLASVEPVVASLLTFLLLGTKFGGGELLGFVCIIVTVIVLAVCGK